MALRTCVNLFIRKQCICASNDTAGLLTPPAVTTFENLATGCAIKADRQVPAGWYKKPGACG
jgi:hypothetical protein